MLISVTLAAGQGFPFQTQHGLCRLILMSLLSALQLISPVSLTELNKPHQP